MLILAAQSDELTRRLNRMQREPVNLLSLKRIQQEAEALKKK